MPLQRDSKESNRYLTLIISDNEYLINMSWVQSIERAEKLELLHGNNTGIIGRYNLGSKISNVYSLNNILGTKETVDFKSGRLIIVKKSDLNIGIYVDAVIGIIEVEKERVFELPVIASRKLSDYFEKIVVLDDRVLFSLLPEYLEGKVSEDIKSSDADDIKELLVRKTSNGNGDIFNVQRVLLFKLYDIEQNISEFTFGISISQVLQIIEPVDVLKVPGSKEFVPGLINWRNHPVPLIDISKRLGYKPSDSKLHSRFIIIRTINHDQLIAFPVYEDLTVRKLPFEHSKIELDLSFSNLYSKGAFKIDTGTLIIPGIDEIVFM